MTGLSGLLDMADAGRPAVPDADRTRDVEIWALDALAEKQDTRSADFRVGYPAGTPKAIAADLRAGA